MYRYSNGQISLADFKQPVGMNLKRGFLVRIAILRLNDAGAQGQTQRFSHIAFPVCE